MRIPAAKASVLLVLWLFFPASVSGSSASSRSGQCASEYSKVSIGKSDPVVHLMEAEVVNGKLALRGLRHYDPNSIYIGIANSNTDGTHHYYLLVNNRRFDGGIYFAKPQVHVGKHIGPTGSKGMMFQIPVPAEVRNALEARLTGGELPRGLTCLHSLCSLLKSEGIEISGTERQALIRTKVVVGSLIDGKIKVRGKDVDPSTVKFWASAEDEISHFFEKAETSDVDQMRSYVLLGISFGGMGYATVDGIRMMIVGEPRGGAKKK